MKKENIIIKKLGINGEGIGYLNKKVVFVKGALVGEEVLVSIDNQNQRFYHARLLKVLSSSNNRRKIECHHNKECLGCTLLHTDRKSQLNYKNELVKDTLMKYYEYNSNQIDLKGILSTDNEFHYKSIVTLPIARINNQVRFGIFQRESRYFTEMNDCLLQNKQINQLLKQLEKLFQIHNVKEYNDRLKVGLRFLIVKEINQKIQLIFITGKDGLKQSLLNDLKKNENILSIYISKNTAKQQEFEIEKYDKVFGKDYMQLTFNNQIFRVSAKSDLPINLEVASLIAKTIQKNIPENVNSILEINAGIGLYTLAIPNHISVKGINTYSYHTNDLIKSTKLNQSTNIEAETGNYEELTSKILKHKPIDTVLLHSDRDPISHKQMEELMKSKIKYLLLLSDNPSTCIKDINKLHKKFACLSIQPFDSSPNNAGMTLLCTLISNDYKIKKQRHRN